MRPDKEIFDTIEEKLTRLLSQDNFQLDKTAAHAADFGSRYRLWKNEAERVAIRLTWDGKDSWFILEESPFTGSQEPISWADLRIVPVDQNVAHYAYYQEIIGLVVAEFE